jgi:hypothetical protein
MKDVKRFRDWQEFLNEGIDPLNLLTQEQVDWCNRHIKGEWGVNEKGEVTVTKNLEFKDRSFDRFPVQFANIDGDFYCGHCSNLVSLEGAPQSVGGDFSCGDCLNLTSLEGAPQSVGGDFSCSRCSNLVSLEGAPKEVGGGFSCYDCPKLPDWETDLIEDYNKKRRTWEEVWKILHKETYRRAAQTGLI